MDTERRIEQLKRRLKRFMASDVADQRMSLVHLARAVVGLPDTGIECEEAQASLPAYVDAEVASQNIVTAYPLVKRHLDLCPACAEAYIDLLELALAEERGAVPVLEGYPTPDLSFLPAPSFVELAREMISRVTERTLAVLAPDMLEELTIIGDIFFARVEELGGRFSLRQTPSVALSLGAGEASTALLFLAASYETTRRIAETFSVQEIQAQADQENLADTLAQMAEKVARETMMSRKEAQVFAQIYAEGARDEISTWLSLAERLHRAG
jgi:hypothetical protein